MSFLMVQEYPIYLDPVIFADRTDTILELPIGSTILHVVNRDDQPVLYAVINTMERVMESVRIFVRATSYSFNIPDYPEVVRYLDTVMFHDNQLALHFFVVEDQSKYRLGPPVWMDRPGVIYSEAQTMPLGDHASAGSEA